MVCGIKRPVDELGRLVIPKELRKHYNIDCGESVVITPMPEGVMISRYEDNNIKHDLQLIIDKYDMDGINNITVEQLKAVVKEIRVDNSLVI